MTATTLKMETEYRKARDGWEGKTYIDLTQHAECKDMGRVGKRKLCITTDKALRGGISTSASVSEHYDGHMRHAFSFGSGGDFSKQLNAKKVRCTEKSIKEMHEAALATVDQLLAEAEAFYAAKGGDSNG